MWTLKKGRKESDLKLERMELECPIIDKKREPFQKLLQQEFGEGWEDEEDLLWYKQTMKRPYWLRRWG